MVEEGPYEILPYSEIEKLKKQIEDLKKNSSSSEILNAISRMSDIMESMLHLFESAASGMKKEGEGALGKKLDKLLDQNETIAESILSLVDMVKELQSKKEYVAQPQPFVPLPREPMPEPIPRMPSPDFSMPPSFGRQGLTPTQKSPYPIPTSPPIRQGRVPLREGPMPMPTGSFKDLSLEQPKKGLFGKLRK